MFAAARLPALSFATEGPTTLLARGGALAEAHPVLFGMVCAGLKTVAADLTVQTVIEKKALKDVDTKRTATFGLFGVCYLGGVQYAVFNKILPRMWPQAEVFAARSPAGKARDVKGVRSLIGLVATEQLIHTPLVFLPAFYMTKEAVEGDAAQRKLDEETLVDRALAKWRKNLIPDMCADMLIWVPSNLVNFAFVPQHFRVRLSVLTHLRRRRCASNAIASIWSSPVDSPLQVPFVALTSFAYTMVLSCMRGGATAPVVVKAPVPAVCAAAAPLEEFAPAPAVVLPAAPLEEFAPVRAAARRRRMFAPAPAVACVAAAP